MIPHNNEQASGHVLAKQFTRSAISTLFLYLFSGLAITLFLVETLLQKPVYFQAAGRGAGFVFAIGFIAAPVFCVGFCLLLCFGEEGHPLKVKRTATLALCACSLVLLLAMLCSGIVSPLLQLILARDWLAPLALYCLYLLMPLLCFVYLSMQAKNLDSPRHEANACTGEPPRKGLWPLVKVSLLLFPFHQLSGILMHLAVENNRRIWPFTLTSARDFLGLLLSLALISGPACACMAFCLILCLSARRFTLQMKRAALFILSISSFLLFLTFIQFADRMLDPQDLFHTRGGLIQFIFYALNILLPPVSLIFLVCRKKAHRTSVGWTQDRGHAG